MRPMILGLFAASLWASSNTDASAAWNNVFQPTLYGKTSKASTVSDPGPAGVEKTISRYVQAIPVCANCGNNSCSSCGQQCTTSYTQRCCYTPVTTYESRSYYEPVTSYQTSYYYEPVTTYRYSCYYDACSCSYQQVATPCTSYQVRSQSCPVQSWVQRCAQVPVTTLRQSCYLEPKTTCCQTSVGAMIPMSANSPPMMTPTPSYAPSLGAISPPQAPMFSNQYKPSAPVISGEFKQSAPAFSAEIKPIVPAGPNVGTEPPVQQQQYGPNQYFNNNGNGNTQPQSWRPSTQQTPPPAAPPVQMRRETIAQGTPENVQGHIAGALTSGSTVLFVNTKTQERRTVPAGATGAFRASLASGEWYVYLLTSGGPQYQEKINVAGVNPHLLTLVSRK